MKKNITIAILIIIGFIAYILFSPKRSKKNERFDRNATIRPPYTFKSTHAEKLSVDAFELARQSDYQNAIDIYTEAIEIEPDNPKLYFDIANCYANINAFSKAISNLDAAIAIDSNYAPFYSNRGLYLAHNSQEELAIPDFKKAIQLDSGEQVFYYNLAFAYHAIDSQRQACKALDNAIRLGLAEEVKKSRNYIILKEFCELNQSSSK